MSEWAQHIGACRIYTRGILNLHNVPFERTHGTRRRHEKTAQAERGTRNQLQLQTSTFRRLGSTILLVAGFRPSFLVFGLCSFGWTPPLGAPLECWSTFLGLGWVILLSSRLGLLGVALGTLMIWVWSVCLSVKVCLCLAVCLRVCMCVWSSWSCSRS